MGAVTGKTWTDYSEPRIMAEDLEAIEAAAASTIVGVGRPDIPATLAPDVATRVASATSGTVFRSTDGPQGAWEWQKRGTAWVVTSGDTGWRMLPALPPFTGHVYLRRADSSACTLTSPGTLSAGAEGVGDGSSIVDSQPGFSISPNREIAVAATRVAEDGSTSRVIQPFVMYGPDLSAGRRIRFSLQWTTDSAWPTSLPGSAA